MTIYRLCDEELELHYSSPNEEGIRQRALPSDRPILQIKRLLADKLRISRIKPATQHKIWLAALMIAYGATWAEIDDVFGDSFAKDLRSRYRDEFRYQKISTQIFKQLSGNNIALIDDGFLEPDILERVRQKIAALLG